MLTVGATDRDDSTAYFSSRGPTIVSHTLKPEIAAPGVAISTAAAGGRGVYAYQSMSGTSMAAPHVAGAAAVLKQRHPEWTARQIKAALVSSAESSVPGDVREVGGGRLDVRAAVDQTVLGQAAVQGGTFHWPQDTSDRTTVPVPYTNTSGRSVTLTLAVEKVTGNDGTPVRSSLARLGKRTVTVPAGATVEVPLHLDPAAHLERARLVDAGTGTPDELKAAGVQGRIALVRFPDTSTSASTVARNAKAAGAVAVLAYRTSPARWYPTGGFTGAGFPVLAVDSAEGAALLAELAADEVTLSWKATAKSPYLYSLVFPETGAIRDDKVYRVRDGQLGRTESTYGSMGVATDFIDNPAAYRPNGSGVFFGAVEPVAAPGTRTEYYTPGDTRWEQVLSSGFPFGEFMRGTAHAYTAGEKRTERWYDGVVAPTAPRDAAGMPVLVAERQGNLIGFADALWGDSTHDAQAGSFGDIGNVRLSRDGELLGESAWPFGVFEVPSANGAYTLEQNVMKIGSEVWARSTSVNSVWKFTSKLDESVYSQGIPILFPRYTLPEDGLKTLAATDDQKIGLTATGHAGYTPAALTSARLSYSYDGGTTWTEAQVSQQDGAWTATVNHAGAAGRPVTLKTELTDSHGNSVTQTVVRAYDVR
ncbi:hypothetical protein GCM10010272_49650 [Streptomyces lateritius]|uniref:S8 family serine peptidase n=1 Tax=Streptomyces lateritius TaxID=67313 RepID=UPI00198A1965|nr:hypothetical protein GCM10010272_49650 [Streptomyces lateritius]